MAIMYPVDQKKRSLPLATPSLFLINFFLFILLTIPTSPLFSKNNDLEKSFSNVEQESEDRRIQATLPTQASQSSNNTLNNAQAKEAEWTVLVYIQAKNNLESFAHKNLNDMAATGSNPNVHLLVQWYQPGQQGVWRYRVDKGKMVLDSTIPGDTDGNKEQDLVDAVRWAHQKYPSKKLALILWNHGLGVVDPIWGNHRPPFLISSQYLGNGSIYNPRIEIEGITSFVHNNQKFDTLTDTELLLLQEEDALQKLSGPECHELLAQLDQENYNYERSILFNEQSKTYMDNQTLQRALASIKLLRGGKKIDLLGMDACLMAMVEICHLAKDYADYLVASQEVELANGWDYLDLCKLISQSSLSPAELAQSIVKIYENFYKNKIQFYTQSAVDLNKIDELKSSIDAMVSAIKKCPSSDQAIVDDCVRKARRSCLQFSAHSYIDLYSFCNELIGNLEAKKTKSKNSGEIKKTITTVMQAVKNAVIANTSGKNLSDAHGLSIYFPINHIDNSYPKTTFAQDSAWTGLIKSIMF